MSDVKTESLGRRRTRARLHDRIGVLHVVTTTSRRGAEIFGLDLNSELAARGRDVLIVALTAGGADDGLPVTPLGRRRLGANTLRRLHREARSARVVVAHGSTAMLATAAISITSRTPFVYRNIGDLRYWLTTPQRRAAMRWVLRRASRVVALWDESAEMIRRMGGDAVDLRIIPNGVPADRFPPIDDAVRAAARREFALDEAGLVAVYVGSLSAEKNVEGAIEAIGSIPDARLLVIGAGPERDRLVSLAEEQAPGRIRFAGSIDDPRRAMAAADLLVLPSHTEGIPAVLIEAAFCQLPVVATAVGGVPTMVIDGTTGILVSPRDTPALAGAIRRATADGKAMGAAGRRVCLERFEIGVVADAWDAMLGELGAW